MSEKPLGENTNAWHNQSDFFGLFLNASLFSDGGARGNPGPAGCGWSLQKNGKEIGFGKRFLGVSTNNIAEYTALIEGMKMALEQGETHLVCHLDSELAVRQIRGEYKVKNEGLKPLFLQVKSLLPYFFHIEFKHVFREQNKRADALANMAMDNM